MSITGDNSPLYIVDGVQVENGLSSLSPQNIQTIDVLKDAAGMAERLKDLQLSGLCISLAENVHLIADHYAEPSEKEVDLIRKVTMAFKMAMKAPEPEDFQPGTRDTNAFGNAAN